MQIEKHVNYQTLPYYVISYIIYIQFGGRRGGDCMVVGFITTLAISGYHH